MYIQISDDILFQMRGKIPLRINFATGNAAHGKRTRIALAAGKGVDEAAEGLQEVLRRVGD